MLIPTGAILTSHDFTSLFCHKILMRVDVSDGNKCRQRKIHHVHQCYMIHPRLTHSIFYRT